MRKCIWPGHLFWWSKSLYPTVDFREGLGFERLGARMCLGGILVTVISNSSHVLRHILSCIDLELPMVDFGVREIAIVSSC
jgi:hypothetical protein